MHSKTGTPTSRQDNSPLAAGALIDEQGREIPITEKMIQQACEALAEDQVYPRPRGQAARKPR